MDNGYISRHVDCDVVGQAGKLVGAPVGRVIPVQGAGAAVPGDAGQQHPVFQDLDAWPEPETAFGCRLTPRTPLPGALWSGCQGTEEGRSPHSTHLLEEDGL